ncbi:MAG: CARDB domain-containing protein [Methanosarcinales archaeon]
MKRAKILAFIFILLFALVGCAPDLVVKDLDVTWAVANKKAKAEIANIGNKDAGNFMVYFNGDEDPVSPNRRPQVRHNVLGLAHGASTILDADFGPLAHPDNNNLGNVYKITVLVDPKGMVKESNENNNVKEVPISHGMACVDFGPPPTVGTQYGSPAGNVPGDVVLLVPNGIQMSVYDFRWTGGGGTFNKARIEMPPHPFGTGQTINTNNINLEFDFTGIGFPVSKVEFQYLDLGGFENFSINGQPVPVYAGELSGVPSPIAGVNVTVTSVPVPGGKIGTVVLTGSVHNLRIGGQEFWIDNVCAKE